MATWVLVLVFYRGGITTVPGYQSKITCEIAVTSFMAQSADYSKAYCLIGPDK